MLEDKLDELISKMDELIAVMGKGGAAATSTKAATTTAKADTKAKTTFDMVKAAVVKVKDNKGKPAAQSIIRSAGKASELASIKPAQYDAVLAACEAALSETDEEAPGEDDTL